jgi:hypothetical protein
MFGVGGGGGAYIGTFHKVLTFIEYRAVSGVFRTIDPPPPLHTGPSPTPKAGGTYTLAGRRGGGGQYFGRRQTLDWPLTVKSLYGTFTHMQSFVLYRMAESC